MPTHLRAARFGGQASTWLANHSSPALTSGERRLERETGIEPATNSLEGCDSTTELLPRFLPDSPLRRAARRVSFLTPLLPRASYPAPPARLSNVPLKAAAAAATAIADTAAPRLSAACRQTSRTIKPKTAPSHATGLRRFGGEGRVRTSVATRAADLQSAAIDRSATSPLTRFD